MSLAERDLSNTDIKRPVFNNVVALCRTGEVREEVGKNDPTIQNLVIPLILEEVVKDTDGKDVHPGFTHTDNIMISVRGKLTQRMIDEKLARFQVAVLKLPGTRGEPWGDNARYSGQLVRVKFSATRPSKKDPTAMMQDVDGYMKA